MSLVELLVSMAVAASAIFTMLTVAARAIRISAVVQSQSIAAYASAQGIEQIIKSYTNIPTMQMSSICNGGNEVFIGTLENDDGSIIFAESNDLVQKQIEGKTVYLLPLKKGDQGRWIQSNEEEADIFRGIGLQKNSQGGEIYINIRSIVYWEVFGESKFVVINSRLNNFCSEI